MIKFFWVSILLSIFWIFALEKLLVNYVRIFWKLFLFQICLVGFVTFYVLVLSVKLLAVFGGDVALLGPLVLNSFCAFIFILPMVQVIWEIMVNLIREIVWVHAAVLVNHFQTLVIWSLLRRDREVLLILILAWEIYLIDKALVLVLVVFCWILFWLFFEGVFLTLLFLEAELMLLLIDKVHELELQIELRILFGASHSLGVVLRDQGAHCDLKEIR